MSTGLPVASIVSVTFSLDLCVVFINANHAGPKYM